MSLLKFSGKGYDAVIESNMPAEVGTDLHVSEIMGQKILFINQGDEASLVLDKEEAIALRNYLVQICPTL